MKLHFTTAQALQKQFPHLFPTVQSASQHIEANKSRIAASVADILKTMGYSGSIFWDDGSDLLPGFTGEVLNTPNDTYWYQKSDEKDALSFEVTWKESN